MAEEVPTASPEPAGPEAERSVEITLKDENTAQADVEPAAANSVEDHVEDGNEIEGVQVAVESPEAIGAMEEPPTPEEVLVADSTAAAEPAEEPEPALDVEGLLPRLRQAASDDEDDEEFQDAATGDQGASVGQTSSCASCFIAS
jgi:hypothetical protein